MSSNPEPGKKKNASVFCILFQNDRGMTLEEFYRLMEATGAARRRIVRTVLDGGAADQGDVGVLRDVRDELARMPGAPGRVGLKIGASEIASNLDYELNELEKDLLFLEGGASALERYWNERDAGFAEAVEGCVAYLSESPPDLFITDRDGTINNYCARYRSSIQSAYNAIFVSRFAAESSRRNMILTSAPLYHGGLLDVNVMPENLFILAGSKGREYRDEHGRDDRLAMTDGQADLMNRLNSELETLTARPEFREFALIGSGLQRKFGQATIARQDSHESIPRERSEKFLDAVRELVERLDATGDGLRIEDTGLDVEIMLTSPGDASAPRGFHKGDGLMFLNERLVPAADGGCALVCGDTLADLPMVEAAARLRPRVRAIFVAPGQKLRDAARILLPDVFFVDSPDILVAALHRAASL